MSPFLVPLLWADSGGLLIGLVVVLHALFEAEVAGGIAIATVLTHARGEHGAWGWRAMPFFFVARSPEIDCIGGMIFGEGRRYWTPRFSSGAGGGIGYVRTDFRQSFGVDEGPRLFLLLTPATYAFGQTQSWEAGVTLFGGFWSPDDDPPIVPGFFLNLSYYF